MATDLGKVGMRARGDWSNSATYEVLDAVSYAGGLYIAKQAVPANTAPTNTTYWQVALNTSLFPNISFFSISANSSVTFNAPSGTLIIFGRNSVSQKGMYFVDNIKGLLEIVAPTSTVTASIDESGNVTITNGHNVSIGCTAIIRFSTGVPA